MSQQTNPTEPNTHLVIALIGAAVVGLVAVSHPTLIPALTLAFAAFMALAAVLKV
ncbi:MULTISPECIES: hypothetical protein [Streptomyces]|uniref:Uncharacterized protein n=1 Tax=Streptomyces globisporus TaxID=1908 RepID=A0A927BKI6_STRGL|nr:MULTISPECIES: hypothetical protein [Streptomyces]MBD2828879.1 hypothetical protein [Streptomyces globisporus]NEC46813.1 hypothetical protein [Streptomyces sp. SID8016]MBD3547779.1 hypothetical protein [Streptomyces sp. JV180]MBD3554083.1 hypothetical protein [Streptomyces sp. SP18CM02]MCC0577925.1 hypothetical protein [Streptomyces californicus]